jgi:hypothetical protein
MTTTSLIPNPHQAAARRPKDWRPGTAAPRTYATDVTLKRGHSLTLRRGCARIATRDRSTVGRRSAAINLRTMPRGEVVPLRRIISRGSGISPSRALSSGWKTSTKLRLRSWGLLPQEADGPTWPGKFGPDRKTAIKLRQKASGTRPAGRSRSATIPPRIGTVLAFSRLLGTRHSKGFRAKSSGFLGCTPPCRPEPAMFREHITYGECTHGGIITVHLRNEELAKTWVGSGGNVVDMLARSP